MDELIQAIAREWSPAILNKTILTEKKMKYSWLVFEFEGYLTWPISFRRGENQVILKIKITVTALVRLR